MINTAEDRVNIASYVKVLQTLGRFHLLPRLHFIYTERNEPQLLFLGSPHLRTFRTSSKLTGAVNADYVQSFLDLLPSTSPKTATLHVNLPLQERRIHAIGRMPQLKFLFMWVDDTNNRLSLGPDFVTNFASHQTLTWWHLQGNISVALPPTSNFPVVDFGSLVYISFVSKTEASIAEYSSLFRVGNFPSPPKNNNPSHCQPYTRTIPFTNEIMAQFLPVPSLRDLTFAFYDRGEDHRTNCIPSVLRRSS